MDKSTCEADLVGMEAYFNELSCEPFSDTVEGALLKAGKFAELLAGAKNHNFDIVRCHEHGISAIELTAEYTLADFVNANLRDTRALLILSMLHPPYFRESSDEESSFVEHDYLLEIPDGNNLLRKSVYGMAAAYLNKSVALNLVSNDYWHNQKVYELIERHGEKVKRCVVYAFSVPEDFDGEYYDSWQVENLRRDFPLCGIEPSDKVCNLSSDHHGNDLLEEFAKNRLFPLPYISKVVTSLRYNPNCRTFVSKLHFDTKRLEVVMHWTDRGYGMLLQTTARTNVELRQMALSLEELFGK